MKRHPRARPSVANKLLRWTLRVLALLLLLVALLVALLLYSTGFLRFAVDTGLGFYNARISGEIRIGRVEGRLIDHLVIGDIVLADRHGRDLVVARELSITWNPWALLHGEVEIELLALRDVTVRLVPGGFADLAIPGPPRATILPELPIDLEVAVLRLKGLDILAADGGEPIVDDLRLELRDLAWSGLDVRLEVSDAAATLPGVRLEGVALAARWSEPTLELRGLITTDLARAELVQVELDAATLDGRALIAVDGRRDALAMRLGGAAGEQLRAAAGDPMLRLDAHSAAGKLDLGVHFELPGRAELDLAASGALRGAPHLELRGRAAIDWRPDLRPLRPVFAATLEGPAWSLLRAELGLTCGDCGALAGLDLQVMARHDATLGASAGQLELEGEVELGPHWTLETYFGDAAIGGVDLFWHRIFGQPRRLANNAEPGRAGTDPTDAPRGDAQASTGSPASAGGGVR